jgi:hypothetical protein
MAFAHRDEKGNEMTIRISLTLGMIAFIFASGVAFAEQPGSTTGPAAGTNVEPSTAIQKENRDDSGAQGAPTAAGSPGVEAKPGSEGGKAPEVRPGGAAPKSGN